MSKPTVEFHNAEALRTNDAQTALLVKLEDQEEALWFPQSTIDEDSEVWRPGDKGTLVVSQWIAEKKNLV